MATHEKLNVTADGEVSTDTGVPSSLSPGAARIAVIGCGLIGTSIAMALRERTCAVFVSDIDAEHQRRAVTKSGASAWDGQEVDVVVIATPPSAVAAIAETAHRQCPQAVITDVASTKEELLSAVSNTDAASVFVGGHPIAGGTSSGPDDADARMFVCRPWAVVPTTATAPAALQLVCAVTQWCGARPVTISAAEHDRVLALTSHAVQILSSAVAGKLLTLPEESVTLSGPALRDVTRVAASDAHLWADILMNNAAALAPQIRDLAQVLLTVADAIDAKDAAALVQFIQQGNAGRRLLD